MIRAFRTLLNVLSRLGQRSVVAVALVAFSGCVHFEENPLDPVRRLKAQESRSLADEGLRAVMQNGSDSRSVKWPPEAWGLDNLTQAALYFHPALETARARLALAEAGGVTAGQRPNPTLWVNPSRNATSTVPTPWILTTTLNIPIETAGKRGHRLAAAEHAAEAARFRLAGTAWGVRAGVRSAFLNLWTALQREAALQDLVVAQEAVLKRVEGRMQAGDIGAVPVNVERIERDRLRLAVLDQRNRQVQARAALAGALGLSVQALEGVSFGFEAFAGEVIPLPEREAIRRALLNRADLLAALQDYAQTEARLQLEIARQYPDVRLNPGYNYNQGDNRWSLGFFLDLPVMNQNEGPIAEAEAARAESATLFQALQTRVLGEIEAALADCSTSRAQWTAALEALEGFKRQEQLALSLLAAGEGTGEALVRARLERRRAALTVLDSRIAAQAAWGRLEAALQYPVGEGTDAPPFSPLMSSSNRNPGTP